MGFRNGSFATVWEAKPVSNTVTQIRLSIDRKNKQTNEYEQDFSGFVRFVGTANAANAARLKQKDHIKLGDVDVTTKYDKEKKVTYTNFTCFSFDLQESRGGASQSSSNAVDSNPIDSDDGASLPF